MPFTKLLVTLQNISIQKNTIYLKSNMDYSLFEDAKCISAIYKEKMPDLQNIEIIKIEMIPGDNADLIVTLDVSELPQQIPTKWLLQKINTVQIEVIFLGVKFFKFDLTNGSKCSFTLTKKLDRLFAVFRNKIDNKEICFEAKWVHANKISAYIKETLNEDI